MKYSATNLLAGLLAALVFNADANAAGVPGQGSWETTLQGRDLDSNLGNGYEAYFDTSLNISWLAQAQAPSGNLSWANAQAYAAGLNVGGVTGWRLPQVTPSGDGACHFQTAGSDCGYNVNTANSELAHLFYVTLGNLSTVAPGGGAQVGGGLSNTGPFGNVFEGDYWTGSAYAPNPAEEAWMFNTGAGLQMNSSQPFTLAVWAVHAGDVAAPVPESQTWALMLVGLAGLAGLARRRHLKYGG
ncbi:PEP-CTERM sorting domain-containing protein [Roseateles sp.]|uniref:PEP-CTERM sorting domain-containing protein n=1 Tax=Roseateles sp. TaxID=1971397 RepID=UPI00286A0EA2|nr:PEP-CTERM sorting domain-containing protein [Roseateles sp.]